MKAIAPNFTIMVGELVGARLIAHAGSLLNLAKHPASTVQILGAEKALFRALKTKHETPKYGLIYHASLIGQAPQKLKGKISRVLAAKTSLAVRYDSFGEGETTTDIGMEARTKVELRLKSLEGGQSHKISGTGKDHAKQQKYDYKMGNNNTLRTPNKYDTKSDSTTKSTPTPTPKSKEKKKKSQDEEETVEETPTKPSNGSKKKKEKSKRKEEEEPMEEEPMEEEVNEEEEEKAPPKKTKKSKKRKEEEPVEEEVEEDVPRKKKKKSSKE